MNDLSQIFNKDPLDLTKTDIDSIISYFREARARYNSVEKQPKKAKTTHKLDINVDDLEL